jgi:hypothetical protein
MDQGGQPAEADADIVDLWKRALDEYEQKTGFKKEKVIEAKDFKDVLAGMGKASKDFDDQRHPDTRSSATAQAINGCLDWVVTGSDFIKDHVDGTVSFTGYK